MSAVRPEDPRDGQRGRRPITLSTRARLIRQPGRPNAARTGPWAPHSPARSSECSPNRTLGAPFASPVIRMQPEPDPGRLIRQPGHPNEVRQSQEVCRSPTYATHGDPTQPITSQHPTYATHGDQTRRAASVATSGDEPRQWRPAGRSAADGVENKVSRPGPAGAFAPAASAAESAESAAGSAATRAREPSIRLGDSARSDQRPATSDQHQKAPANGNKKRSSPVSPRRLGPTDSCRLAPQSSRSASSAGPSPRTGPASPLAERELDRTKSLLGPIPRTGTSRKPSAPSPNGPNVLGRYEPGRPEPTQRSPTPARTRGSCFVDPAALQFRDRALRELFGPYRPRRRKL